MLRAPDTCGKHGYVNCEICTCPSCASLLAANAALKEEVGRLKQYWAIARKVTHCEFCGGSWYDDGLNSGCSCKRIKELEKLLLDAVMEGQKGHGWATGKAD